MPKQLGVANRALPQSGVVADRQRLAVDHTEYRTETRYWPKLLRYGRR